MTQDFAGKTRYGNNPSFRNTFSNFQHVEKTSPMYMADTERLRADNMSRTAFQREDQAKKAENQESRLQIRRVHSHQILKRLNDQTANQESRYESRLNNKAVANMIYQHVSSK